MPKGRQTGEVDEQATVDRLQDLLDSHLCCGVRHGGGGSQASLAKLNELLGEEQAVPMQRFRPNLVVAGTQPWEEDDWETYTISGPAHSPCKFSATMPCDRCKVRLSKPEVAPCGCWRCHAHATAARHALLTSAKSAPLSGVGMFRNRCTVRLLFYCWSEGSCSQSRGSEFLIPSRHAKQLCCGACGHFSAAYPWWPTEPWHPSLSSTMAALERLTSTRHVGHNS